MPDQQEQFVASIASEAVEILEDHLLFPRGYLLPLSARGSGVPGMADRPWSRLTADAFHPNLPVMYSLSLRREPPDVLRGSLRAKRTLFEGFMMALAEKTGRRPSLAERSTAQAMDAAESELTFGKPAFLDAIAQLPSEQRNYAIRRLRIITRDQPKVIPLNLLAGPDFTWAGNAIVQIGQRIWDDYWGPRMQAALLGLFRLAHVTCSSLHLDKHHFIVSF